MDATELQQRQRYEFIKGLNLVKPGEVAAAIDAVNFLTPAERERWKRWDDERVTQRRRYVKEWVDRDYESFTHRADGAEEKATTIASDIDDLVAAVQAGTVPLAEFQERFSGLERRVAKAQRTTDDLARQSARLEEREEDPDGYMAELERKFPAAFKAYGATGDPHAVDWTRSA